MKALEDIQKKSLSKWIMVEEEQLLVNLEQVLDNE